MTPAPFRRAATEDAPLFAGAIHGVRGWSVRRGRLVAPYRETVWEPGGVTRAACDAHRAPPARGCGCGLYAFHPFSSAIEAYHHQVLGVVEAWGRVELHADGFRAERARPVALFVREAALADERARVERLARRYGCELIRLGRGETPALACAKRGWGIDARTVADLLGVDYEPGLAGGVVPLGGVPVGGLARRRRGPVDRVVDAVATAARWIGIALLTIVVGVVWLALYATFAATFVLGGLALLGVDVFDEAAEERPPLERASDVEVTGAWTVDFGRGMRVHAVELTNRGERVALDARPALAEVAGGERDEVGAFNVEVPVNLAPGERGLALHPVASDDPQARSEPGRVWAREGPPDVRAPARLDVRIERRPRGCVALARIDAQRPLRRLELWALGLGVGGEPEHAIYDAVRDVPVGRSEQVLGRAGHCPTPIPRYRVYPAFRAGQLAGASDGR